MKCTWKKLFIGAVFTSLLLSACSQTNNVHKENTQAKESNNPPAVATDIQGILKQKPGKFSGNHFDVNQLKKIIQSWPKNMSAQEAYNRIVPLVAEDYASQVKKLDNLDPTVQSSIKQPGSLKMPNGQPLTKMNVEILIDSSGSMAGKVQGHTKMDLAKQAVQQFAANLPEGANVAVRVYGNKGTNSEKDKAISCSSSEILYPLQRYDASRFQQSIANLKPAGWTPLAASIKSAQNDLAKQQGEGVQNIIYVVSDGVETCGGNPVQEAKNLHNSNIKAVINIIGFDVDDAGQKALKAVAEAGGGSYQTVNNQEDLKSYFEREKARLDEEWIKWSNDSWMDIQEKSFDKWMELREIISDFHSLNSQENDHLHSLKTILLENNKIKNEDELKTMIVQRFELIKKYIIERDDSIETALKNNTNKSINDVNKKEQEERNKLK
jgi:Ca-activated chloride channel family protein